MERFRGLYKSINVSDTSKSSLYETFNEMVRARKYEKILF